MTAKQLEKMGSIPQITMIMIFGINSLIYLEPLPLWAVPISLIGSIGFLYCLWVLYVQNKRTKGLVTTGLFKYSRHPMYISLFLMNIVFWITAPITVYFVIIQILWLTMLILAGWFQEKETLARFGKEAEEYYSRTPRILIL